MMKKIRRRKTKKSKRKQKAGAEGWRRSIDEEQEMRDADGAHPLDSHGDVLIITDEDEVSLLVLIADLQACGGVFIDPTVAELLVDLLDQFVVSDCGEGHDHICVLAGSQLKPDRRRPVVIVIVIRVVGGGERGLHGR
jgi:hypothetical protein